MVTLKLHLCPKNTFCHSEHFPFLGIDPEEIIIVVNIAVILKDVGQHAQ